MPTNIPRRIMLALFLATFPAPLVGQTPKSDVYGDPLPAGAIARLGTVRWRHGDGTTFVAFMPDGKALLSVGRDGTVRQWDVATGKELRRFGLPGQFTSDVENVNRLGARVILDSEMSARQIALAADGKVLALGDAGTIHLWEVATGKEQRKVSVAGGQPLAIALSSDSKTLAVQDADGTIRL